MNGFCEGKTKANVWFKFPNKKWENFETTEVPVSYTLTENEDEAGGTEATYIAEGTIVNANTVSGACGEIKKWVSAQIKGPGIKLQRLSNGVVQLVNAKNETAALIVEGSSLQGVSEVEGCMSSNFIAGFALKGSTTLSLIKLVGEPTEPGQSCTFRVFANDKEIYKEKGEKCPQVKIACDNDCPSNFLKCKTSSYPGYKCIPCEQFRS